MTSLGSYLTSHGFENQKLLRRKGLLQQRKVVLRQSSRGLRLKVPVLHTCAGHVKCQGQATNAHIASLRCHQLSVPQCKKMCLCCYYCTLHGWCHDNVFHVTVPVQNSTHRAVQRSKTSTPTSTTGPPCARHVPWRNSCVP